MSDDPHGEAEGRASIFGPWREVAFRTVDDPRAARILADPEATFWLEPFLGRVRSASEAARELGRPLDAVRYRLRRMADAGLVEVVGERRRSGRPVKLWRSVADGFVVPFEATPYADLEERIRRATAANADRFARSAATALREGGVEARRIYRGPDGAVHDEAAIDEAALHAASDADPVESLTFRARLPRSVARAVLNEMIALARRTEAADAEPGPDADGPVREYVVQLQIAPVPDDERRGDP